MFTKIKKLQEFADHLIRKAGLDFHLGLDGKQQLHVCHSCYAEGDLETVHLTMSRIWSMS